MNEYIIKEIKKMIEANQEDWARMFIIKAKHSGKDNAESKVEVDKSTHRMGEIEDNLNFLRDFLKKHAAKAKAKK